MSRVMGRKAAARLATIALLALAGTALISLHPTAGARAAASAFVRVNQVGYPVGTSKRAYLMSTAVETGATFSVKNQTGTTVLSAPIGANLGKWSSSYSNVYALDFDPVTTAGTYTISVSGPIAASSPAFRIDGGGAVYSGALANALSFYQTERDGPNFIANPLRSAAAHLNDQNAMTYQT